MDEDTSSGFKLSNIGVLDRGLGTAVTRLATRLGLSDNRLCGDIKSPSIMAVL
jgi:hypothetical protein